MENFLDVDSILSDKEVDNLFSDEGGSEEDTPSADEEKDVPAAKDDEKEPAEDSEEVKLNPNDLFDGDEEDDSTKKPDEAKTVTKSKSVYADLARALKKDGVISSDEDDDFNSVSSSSDFKTLIENEINKGLSDRQKKIDTILTTGVEPSDIKKYENTLEYLNSIDDDKLSDESDEGENLRKQLIYQDFINRGYSNERAQREVKKSLDAGTDLEDAQEAINSNKDFFQGEYDNLIQEAKDRQEQRRAAIQKQSEDLKNSIMSDSESYTDFNVDKNMRKKIYDNISKPVYKDPNSGEVLTVIQKYEREHTQDFLKNLGYIYTVTNGFKDFNGFVKPKVRKEINKGLRELENTLNNTARTSDGNLKFVSSEDEEPESFIKKGWSLDV